MEGTFRKMSTSHQPIVQYTLTMGDEAQLMNDLLGHEITLSYTGQIFCKDCGRKTKKSFNQGFCYPCFMNSPLSSPCIIHPEKCQAHLGIGRDMEWEKTYHLCPQFVYLSLTAGAKVGITREGQIPTRWIDQGARQAIIIAKTPNRYTAGMMEVALKQHISDKTSWQKMLKDEVQDVDLELIRDQLVVHLDASLSEYLVQEPLYQFNYPVLAYPQKVKSINLDKTPIFKGRLTGIKAQYLMFDEQFVINVRKYEGYEMNINIH